MPQQTKLDTLSPSDRIKLVMAIQTALFDLKHAQNCLDGAQPLLEVEITIDDLKTMATEIDTPLDAWAIQEQAIFDQLELLYEKGR